MTTENRDDQVNLVSLLLQSQNPDIQTRDHDQSDGEAPHIAPGWNAVMVQDIIAGMFLLEADEQAGDTRVDKAVESHVVSGEMEKAIPGFAHRVSKAVETHIVSDRLYTSLYEEARDIACAVVDKLMTAEERQALLDAAGRVLREDE